MLDYKDTKSDNCYGYVDLMVLAVEMRNCFARELDYATRIALIPVIVIPHYW